MGKKKRRKGADASTIVQNKKARHDYFIEDSFEAGLALVCLASLLLALVRSWGIPARYAMGYVDPGYFDDGRPLATHAWAEVLIPGAGWRGFDPSHGLLVNDSYILVAVGRDYQDAAPLRGSFKGDQAGDEPAVELSIMREE